jgi:hypothetical protein
MTQLTIDEVNTILSLCDYSGIWSDPYKGAGYNVIKIDIEYGQDVRLLDYPGGVYGIIAQSPCTHLAGSGARWWKDKGQAALIEALGIADACLRFVALCRPKWWVLENPVGRLARYYGKPTMYYDPYEYAGWCDNPADEAYTKKTCLWGVFNIPHKKPVEPVLGSKMHLLPPSPDRPRLRGLTPVGFARAFFEANNEPTL